MPNIQSAKKRVKVIAKKTARNRANNSALKTVLKKANISLAAEEDSTEVVRLAMKKVDQACAKGLLHKNTAARKKSLLARKLNTQNS